MIQSDLCQHSSKVATQSSKLTVFQTSGRPCRTQLRLNVECEPSPGTAGHKSLMGPLITCRPRFNSGHLATSSTTPLPAECGRASNTQPPQRPNFILPPPNSMRRRPAGRPNTFAASADRRDHHRQLADGQWPKYPSVSHCMPSIFTARVSPGADGSTPHRQGPRCRDHRDRPALFCDGLSPGHSAYRLLRPTATQSTPATGVVRQGLPGRAARPPKRHHRS